MSIKLSIILVNYNLAPEADACLESLDKYIDRGTTEVIVVDNGSTEKNLKEVANKYSGKASFYFIEKNLGFGGGNNYGASKANGEILCLLNTDTVIERNIFSEVIELFDRHPEITVLGPRLKNLENITEYSIGEFPTTGSEFLRIFSPGGRKSDAYLQNLSSGEPKLFPVDWVTGAAFFVRRDAFDKAKGFDENIFMYNEETDFCKRITAAGGRVYFYSSDGIIHIKSVSSRKNYYLFTVRSYESKLYYLEKHFNGMEGLIVRKMLGVQVLVQMILWFLLIPFYPSRSIGKLKGFGNIFAKIVRSLFNFKLLGR